MQICNTSKTMQKKSTPKWNDEKNKFVRTKRKPKDACAVHCKTDKTRLVEIFGNFTRLKRVKRARDDQHHIVHQRDEQMGCGCFTREYCIGSCWELNRRAWWIEYQPKHWTHQLHRNDCRTDAHLGDFITQIKLLLRRSQ